MSAIALGALAAFPSYFGLIFRTRTTLDDSLDVVAAHGLGGMVGALLTGVFAQKALNGVADGLLFGNPRQLGIQAAAVLASIAYSGVMTLVLLKVIGAVMPLRVDAADQATGLDLTQHGEEAYVHGESSMHGIPSCCVRVQADLLDRSGAVAAARRRSSIRSSRRPHLPPRPRRARPFSFDVTSVKVNKSGDWRKSLGPAPGGRFLATNNTLRDLIPFAYGLPQTTAGFRIIGGPKWIDEDHFDIAAKVDGTWTPQQMSEMLRTMLADRFKLSAHHETREMPTYALVMAKGPQAFGPHLRRSEIDEAACAARRAAIQRREPVPPVPPGAKPVCGTGRSVPGITAVGFSIDARSRRR